MLRLIKARSGVNSVIIKQAGENPYHWHSTVDPIQEAGEWLNHIQLEEYTAYVVLGCGLGYHVRALWDNLPKNSILFVFTTDLEFNIAMQEKNRGPLYNLQDKRIFFICGSQLYDIAVSIANTMIDYDVKKIEICKHYPTMRMNADFYALCEEKLVDLIGEKMALTFNVSICTGKRFIENYWNNISYIATNPGIANFENAFRGWPCIVVASGPSLNKNIDILKNCLPYAVIIAAGSTMGALRKHGITPHFLVVTDANPEMFAALDGYCNEHTVLVASKEVYHKVVSRYPGRCCFTYTSDDSDRNLFAKYLPPTMQLKQTASVATAAVDFANHCGAEKIIMVGQDLAFAEDTDHADGVNTVGYECERVEVPGYFGDMVSTIYQFKIAIEYLESYVKTRPNIRFINATQGGAKIAGMEQLPLHEVKNLFLATQLPIEDKINRIFEEFGAENSGVDPLIHEMLQYQSHCCNVLHELENYAQEHSDFWMVAENQEIEEVDVKTVELCRFFNEIKNHAFAPSYKIFLSPRLQLIEFYKQDRLQSPVIYQLYIQLFNEFKEFIDQLHQWIEEALNSLKNEANRMDR